jgi:AcrR family transcriptional regulator
MPESDKVGLRDRKRQETRTRIEDAAVTLALRDGLDTVTIDAISELAEISPRTFFNYFDSKEDAVIGLHGFELTREVLDEHAERTTSSDMVESVVGLLFAVWGTAITGSSIRESRMELLRRHPQLLERHIAQMNRMAQQLSEAVQAIAARNPDFAGRSFSSPSWSDPVLALCGAAVRTTVKEWVATGSTEPAEELEARAIALVREVIEILQ